MCIRSGLYRGNFILELLQFGLFLGSWLDLVFFPFADLFALLSVVGLDESFSVLSSLSIFGFFKPARIICTCEKPSDSKGVG